MSAATKTRTKSDQNVKAASVDDQAAMIEDAFEKIRNYRGTMGTSKAQVIACLCGIGSELRDLKTQIPHGKWEQRVEAEFGINKDTAARLMQIADSWLNEQILTLGQDLKSRLTTDVQKLAILIKLPKKRLAGVLKRYDLSQISRQTLREVVAKMRAGRKTGAAAGQSHEHRSNTHTATKNSTKSEKKPPQKRSEEASPLDEVIRICGELDADFKTSVLTALDGDELDKDLAMRAAKAVDEARAFLDELHMALKERCADAAR